MLICLHYLPSHLTSLANSYFYYFYMVETFAVLSKTKKQKFMFVSQILRVREISVYCHVLTTESEAFLLTVFFNSLSKCTSISCCQKFVFCLYT